MHIPSKLKGWGKLVAVGMKTTGHSSHAVLRTSRSRNVGTTLSTHDVTYSDQVPYKLTWIQFTTVTAGHMKGGTCHGSALVPYREPSIDGENSSQQLFGFAIVTFFRLPFTAPRHTQTSGLTFFYA